MSNPKELVYFPTWTAGRKGYADRMREVFQEYLKGKDQHATKQRQLILDHLLNAERHLSQDDIYQALRPRGIGKVTIFRTLKMLEDCFLVTKVTPPDSRPRYEVTKERPHHDHLVCLDCGGITEVQWPEVERIQDVTCKKYGFAVVYHRHELFGHCRDCQGPRN
jgi:Fur family ferric uptake transcriptional regulator